LPFRAAICLAAGEPLGLFHNLLPEGAARFARQPTHRCLFLTAPPSRRLERNMQAVALAILLVEDDPLIRLNTAELLQDLGHIVVEAGNAEDAMEALDAGPVDVIITDLGLPGLSGADFASMARKAKPDIAIVFATGAEPGPDLIGNDAASYLLRKPFGAADVAAALQAVR
jgi:CheY-like chemotaxis protein